MATFAEREAFEAWHAEKYWEIHQKEGSAGYRSALENARWEAWQASRQALANDRHAERYPETMTDHPRRMVQDDFVLKDCVPIIITCPEIKQ